MTTSSMAGRHLAARSTGLGHIGVEHVYYNGNKLPIARSHGL